MAKMSIHRALAELKLLDKRIEKRIANSDFIGIKGKAAKFVYNTTLQDDEFISKAVADYQAITDLIKRRALIKKLIVLSNSKTEVTIGGVKYTVAEAIEAKKIVEIKKKLLTRLKSDYNYCKKVISNNNEEVNEKIDEQIKVMLGSDKQNKISGFQDFIQQYKDNNEWIFVDGINIADKIEKLTKEIEDFENNVDYVLSESNAITQISIPD
ncbi:hypothetical protein [Clostridium sp. SM-530-WT-3G]|uniref:hypothetical protein n=1 Tax=Clostridium sp. SM-530-WT-3G TaxID=2725303 RepID=UPI000EC4988D|nr:hypothetical protein [Clostridium sp. SM-530-WT-3G]NME82358.1 hypothetical protein [Clostridium sp. SM-530-WT-3G]HCW54567.1 hypothetical protein [Clostridium sp.]